MRNSNQTHLTKTLKVALAICALFLLAFALIPLSSISTVEAGSPVFNTTHLGQLAGNHVTLEVAGGLTGGCGPALLDFVRVFPDGTSSGPFRVPAGQALVVTDVDWQYVSPDGAAVAGRIQVLRLSIENLADPNTSRRALDSTITLSSTGEGGISESMTSGFVVSSKARICPDLFPGPQGPPFGLQHLILRGYLTEY